MIFAIYIREGDTCGNSETMGPYGYVEADSKLAVEDMFPKGFLVGYNVQPVVPQDPLLLKSYTESVINRYK